MLLSLHVARAGPRSFRSPSCTHLVVDSHEALDCLLDPSCAVESSGPVSVSLDIRVHRCLSGRGERPLPLLPATG